MTDKFRISREYTFSSAHRIPGHPKCGRLHGHNYRLVVVLESDSLDSDGFVIDFGDIDKVVKPEIDLWDHRYLLSQNEQKNPPRWLQTLMETNPNDVLPIQVDHTSAEELARQIFTLLDLKGVPVVDVKLWETERNMAQYSRAEGE